MRTRVCITIDTEFSIGGAFADAARQPVGEPMVWCEVGGRSQGLGFMLEQFQRHQIGATFFVEALQRQYFRHDPMAAIAQRIAAEGHEVQLHAHPCWSVFGHADWPQRVRAQPRQDDFFGRAEDDSVALIRRGQEAFGNWGVAAPTVFRSGSLQHDATLYRALARCAIPYSSCVGLAIFDSGDPDYALYSGVHPRAGVLECPVLTFQDWRLGARRHLKTLTIAGTSFAETRTLLEQAHAAGVPLVVLLTHPFEYVQRSDSGAQVRRHAVNQERLAQLCAWLDAERARFDACGMGAAAAALADSAAARRNVLLQGRPWQSLRRMATQVAYDWYGGRQLARQRGVAA
ncbi:polysaccharide deacetylase [Pseudoduganella sp. DS3]|uniref:Polysaccharide deacetylase n=1 Tax=Pseudoduganella guangdongensis TaxID=2692179 RepID=A0A6N9HN96_9BURK|nr:polysaccharide deacetylase [Pseudoduganella guangdongensis]MYN05201.1 polysaccharide deacetylase [Pseudoduganella guangdongensis]